MYIFSVKQRSHDRFPFLYDGARATIDHLIFGSGFNFFSQMWDDSVVLCWLPSFLNDSVWPYHRLLKLNDCAPHVLRIPSVLPPAHPTLLHDIYYMTSVCPVVVKRAFVLVPPLAAALFSLPGWLLFVSVHDFCVVGRDDALNVFGATV